MSLAQIFNDATDLIFNIIDDLAFNAEIVNIVSTYDANTRDYNVIETSETVEVVQYDFEHQEIDGEAVRKGDTRFIIRVKQLSNGNQYDYIQVLNNKWDIKNFEYEPSKSIIIFHCRLQGDIA